MTGSLAMKLSSQQLVTSPTSIDQKNERLQLSPPTVTLSPSSKTLNIDILLFARTDPVTTDLVLAGLEKSA